MPDRSIMPNGAAAHYGPGAPPEYAPPIDSLVIYEDTLGAVGVAVYEGDKYVEPGIASHPPSHIVRWWLAPSQSDEIEGAGPAADVLEVLRVEAQRSKLPKATRDALEQARRYILGSPTAQAEAERLLRLACHRVVRQPGDDVDDPRMRGDGDEQLAALRARQSPELADISLAITTSAEEWRAVARLIVHHDSTIGAGLRTIGVWDQLREWAEGGAE